MSHSENCRKELTLGELLRFGNPPSIEIRVWSDHEQRFVPAKAREAVVGSFARIIIEPLSWVERGGDI